MKTMPAELIPPRASLLNRLKDLEDQASWHAFVQTYRELIYRMARKAGLNETEAEEVVQETFISVAKKMLGFTYDPAKDSFKGWLLTVTRWRMLDQVWRRSVGVQGSASACPAVPDAPGTLKRGLQREDGTRTATIERVPDPAGFDLTAIRDEERQKKLLQAAPTRIKRQVHPQHYEIYHLHVILEKSVREVARALGISVGQVYLARHRVGALLRKEIKRLESRSGVVPLMG